MEAEMTTRRKPREIKPTEPQFRVLAVLSMAERIKEACTALEAATTLAKRAGLDAIAETLMATNDELMMLRVKLQK